MAMLATTKTTKKNNFKLHSTWNNGGGRNALNKLVDTLEEARNQAKISTQCEYNDRGVPFYRVSSAKDLESNADLMQDIYEQFFEEGGPGCVGFKNVFDKNTMDEYNKFCEKYIETDAKHHCNCRHPKQLGKYVINNLMEALSEQNPTLLMKLINNPVYNKIMDILLGHSCIGAFTTHWIEGGADRQLSHVDYPMHVGSGKFWTGDITKAQNLITRYQMNHVLPFFSVQTLIASDAMDVNNGSTEVVPYSNQILDIDVKIHDAEFYKSMEDKFMNVSLEQGDIFIFNRRLCHRGGKNLSEKRRNSAIMQCVWLFGIGQHDTNTVKILQNVLETDSYKNMSEMDKEKFHIRLKQPYPINTTKHN